MPPWNPSWRLWLVPALLLPQQALRAEPPAPAPAVTVQTGGKLIPEVDGVHRLPASAKQFSLSIGNPSADYNREATRRIRTMLEGVDAGWKEREGVMNFVIRFYDRWSNQVGQHVFPCAGVSSGWKGLLDESIFTHRRESVIAPPEADRICIILSSAGPPSSVGVFAVDDITISRAAPEGQPAEKLLEFPGSWSGTEVPKEWIASGSHPSLAQILRLGKPGLTRGALAIVDDDPTSHGEWQLSGVSSPKVRPGERLVVEWNELFNIGEANSFTISYPVPPPGRYEFLANELDVFGTPTRAETTTPIEVPVPYWKRTWFLVLEGAVAVALAVLATRALIRWKLRRQMEALLRERMLEQERLRIARDIHDDLGARLTHISLISGMAENNADTTKDRDKFTEISGMARELVLAMYETVWSVNPQNDHLESLVSFLCQSTENLCKPADIRCRIRVSPIPEDLTVRSEIRHHVLLAVKETIHNAIKHSAATEIELQVIFTSPNLHVVVSDDGRGFDPATQQQGHGLKNLHRRMETIGGSAVIESTENQGTRIRFVIPISYAS